jgi:dTDP-4-amino-4,6-dideoxygalactose transaminase
LRVPLADLALQYRMLAEEVDAAIHEVLESGRFVLGPMVEKLEEEIATFSGARYGIAVNSGTDALFLALKANGIGPGCEVITTPFTFVATVEAIVHTGATPVFADIDPRTFNLCPQKVAERITARTTAIIPVDLFGQMADRAAFGALAERYHLALIYDSAQAIGARFMEQPLASFPGTATLSFFPTKNLGAYGDGGMVLTNDTQICDRARQLRFHGSGGGYFYTQVGYCSRLDAIQAAILRVKLKHLPQWNAIRRRHAKRYDQRLAGICGSLPYVDPRAHHVYHQYTLRYPQRDALREHLSRAGIDTGVYYPLPLHLQEAYRSLGYRPGDFPVAERVSQEVLSIPIHPELSNQQIDYVATEIRHFDELPTSVERVGK